MLAANVNLRSLLFCKKKRPVVFCRAFSIAGLVSQYLQNIKCKKSNAFMSYIKIKSVLFLNFIFRQNANPRKWRLIFA